MTTPGLPFDDEDERTDAPPAPTPRATPPPARPSRTEVGRLLHPPPVPSAGRLRPPRFMAEERGEREPDADAAPEPASTTPARRVLTVSELSARLRDAIESRFSDVWVEGELSNARVWTTGHLYFTLKDSGAQLKGVMFRSTLQRLKFKPQDGLHVTVRGRLSVYDPKGEYQIVAEHMEPQGYGPLQLAFEQLKKRLQADGLFAPERKRPLPALPRRIGLVTSIDGAALRDMVRVLRRRYPNAHLIISPTRVQGDGAAAEIAKALRAVARVDAVDVVIVARGGGSLEDLWAFNEEAVARAIADAPVPVISGVGHETDFTIADFVADLRAPTPSAAAEIVVGRKDEFTARIDRLCGRLDAAASHRLTRLEARLRALEGRPAFGGLPARVAMRGRHVAELRADLGRALSQGLSARARRAEALRRTLGQYDPRHRLSAVRTRLVERSAALSAAIDRRRHRAESRFRQVAARLDGLSPLAVLGRGYAVCWDGTRTRVVRDAATLATGDDVRVTLGAGEIRCTVDEILD
ncbi:MAG: exodeoxyribonuclease VII large subunit [Vicinamibacterales bacterium]